MNEVKKIMPESYYSLDPNISLEKIIRAKESDDFLVGKVLFWNFESNTLKVYLGNGINAELPISEASVYPSQKPDGRLNPIIYSIIGKNICSFVKTIEENKIILSRKQNMLKAFEIISRLNGEIVTCYVNSTIQYGLFVDVGHGIRGLIHNTDLTTPRVHNPEDVGFFAKKFIDAKIYLLDNENYHVKLNYKNQFEDLSTVLHPGDIIDATILDPVNDIEDGYYAFLNPNTRAIIDPPAGLKLPYGSKAVARVKLFRDYSPDKVRLSFISFI